MRLNLQYKAIIVLMCISMSGWSQQTFHKFEVGGFLGQTGYLGDLNKSDLFSKEPKPGVGGLFRYNINSQFALRGGLTLGGLSGKDENYTDRAIRGFSTKSFLTDLSGIIEWDPLNKKRFTYDSTNFQVKFKKKFSPFVFLGGGLAFTNPKPDFTGTAKTWDFSRQGALQDQKTDYSKVNFVVPVGVGVRYDLSANLVLSAEVGFRLVFSDYLDGISKAANPSLNDRYKFSGLSLSYRLDKKDKDNDGIIDAEDQCPNEPGSIKMKGCPDKDKDGIADKDDQCPENFGLASLDGCPDEDGDGIRDKDDDCPSLAGLVALKGCPDKDGDGIADKDDTCPTEAGLPAFKGCPDTDKDGVPDKDDACPQITGLISLKGCPDSDGDGVADKDDSCPTTAGLLSLKGCPDRDGDGVADKDDECPDLAGVAMFKGCPDTDNDGVEDIKDRCIDIAGKVEFEGCPDEKTLKAMIKASEDKLSAEKTAAAKGLMYFDPAKRVMDVKIEPILFETAKAIIRPEFYSILDAAAEMMKSNSNYRLRIIGHADEVGDTRYNQRLSEKRGEACFDYLLKKGVTANRMSFIGFGEKSPKITNKTEDGKKQNRRVEIETYKN